jgi:hypothetical protein
MLEWWRNNRSTAPAVPAGEAAEVPPAERPATEALIPRSRERRYPKVIMTLVLGLDEATLGPLVREMTAVGPTAAPPNGTAPAPSQRALEPVLVTDCMAFALFRDAGLIFEYLPAPAVRQRHAPDLAWDVYIARRLERLRHKWAPVRIVAVGAVARDVLARQLASPFASADLPTLVGAAAPLGQSSLSSNPLHQG